jgi:hypothetical protein
MYVYEIITFGTVLSVGQHRSKRALRPGDVLSAQNVDWRVERVEQIEGSVTRLICVEADASNPPQSFGGHQVGD